MNQITKNLTIFSTFIILLLFFIVFIKHTYWRKDGGHISNFKIPIIRVGPFDDEVSSNFPDISIRPRTNVTLVTALLEIGRNNWTFYGRPIDRYQEFFSVLLQLDMDMIIYVTSEHYEIVKSVRKSIGLWDRTKVFVVTLKDLPLYKYLNKMRQIIDNELNNGGWKDNWDISMKKHPEATSAEYDLVVNSKPYFLYNATIENTFNSSSFVWLDAGYCHGQKICFPKYFKWYPTIMRGKISMIKLTPDIDKIEDYSIDRLYRQDWAGISGGFIGGDLISLKKFYHYHFQKTVELLYQNFVDDDQTVVILLIKEMPELFNLEYGDWFDAFKLF
uniref:Nucleotide-diphospho-sugar transferase domain-containing protein n=1 Tax=Strongyloides papillosus TaxID=174720 RepID=A0A0N5CD50_STREA